MKSATTAATARLIEYDSERWCASGEEAAYKYAAGDRIDARRVSAIFAKAHAWIFLFEMFVPFMARMDDAAHLQFPEQ